MIVTFALAMVGWVFFRAKDLPQSVAVIRQMFSFAPGRLLFEPWQIELALLALGIAVAEELAEWSEKIIAGPALKYALWIALILFCTEIFGAIDAKIPFIYFQF